MLQGTASSGSVISAAGGRYEKGRKGLPAFFTAFRQYIFDAKHR